ncbi:MAG: hypothetical protein P9E24_04930 [Candidatus Competibacter sp.]|nr:hypothetical protein [Candidatus Competibacter sp.]MDG4584029.1 hypothetical protein [Candidatus Competibacter sp.]
MDKYPELIVERKSGKERFHIAGKCFQHDLLSFWQWSSSDLVNNALRGVLAEYIVATALDETKGNRTEWDAFDIETKEGIKIEVKSGAYIQSWPQNKLSSIQFGIRPTREWDSRSNTYSSEVKRQSDVYVFCVLAHKDQKTIDPLNMHQWEFYVLETDKLNNSVGNQKTITLSALKQLNPVVVQYPQLGSTIRQSANKQLRRTLKSAPVN